MSKTILDALRKIVFGSEFADVLDVDGNILRTPDAEIKVGDAITMIDEAGVETPAADGKYVIEDGRTLVVADGAVSEIIPAAEEDAPEGETEGKKLADAEATMVTVPEGTYTLDDGTVINVDANGYASYDDMAAGEAPAEEAPAESAEFAALKEANEKLQSKFALIEEKLRVVAGEPADEKIDKTVTTVNKEDMLERIARLRK